ncbi:pyruvoyl-dependent arginine decarboxylase [Halobacterium rubrum]|uniref:pyruvoyl-dependent arginine decarboxylase n=1 Tax=Halobacterium TaxID=2239 RepID=UPI001F47C404|nr:MULTISPECIES: pyruvoyl-dependent arginine decarboxylase [Halobacterium]MDH5019223.1 pyruvoyl-dependent arginine decarboxylase [Halobacterium rubrum]
MSSRIRVAWGTGAAPTEMAAYDAALADANLHNYNLVGVSSVIPADAGVDAVGTAPDLGPAGNKLTVVEAHANTAGPGHTSAALAWAERGDDPGLFYEAAGETSDDDVESRVTAGIEAGLDLRGWDADDPAVRSVTVEAEPGEHAAAVVVAAYGDSDPVC